MSINFFVAILSTSNAMVRFQPVAQSNLLYHLPRRKSNTLTDAGAPAKGRNPSPTPLSPLAVEPGRRAYRRALLEFLDMIARLAARPIIRHELAQSPAREILTETAMLYVPLKAARRKMAIRMLGCPTPSAPGRIVGTLAAIIPAEPRKYSIFHDLPSRALTA
jgi:hypothetical protein